MGDVPAVPKHYAPTYYVATKLLKVKLSGNSVQQNDHTGKPPLEWLQLRGVGSRSLQWRGENPNCQYIVLSGFSALLFPSPQTAVPVVKDGRSGFQWRRLQQSSISCS